MKDTQTKTFDHFLHPYLFVLKEGNEIHDDFLDYSLLLLQVGQPDVLPSPQNLKSVPTVTLQLLRR